jgi:peptidoglycan/LPS O-acetylase OafA/YrhL
MRIQYILISVLSLLLITAYSQGTEEEAVTNCENYLQAVLSQLQNFSTTHNISTLTPTEENILIFSGKDINDLGDYDGCLATSTNTFVTVRIIAVIGSTPVQFFVGLCTPVECTAEDYTAIMASTMPANSPLSFKFIDSVNYPIQTGFSLVFTILLMITLCSFMIIGSFLNNFKELMGKRRRETNATEEVTQSLLSETPKAKVSNFDKFMKCFDVRQNLNKIFDTRINEAHDNDLNVLNGVRTLSFFYVVYGHDYAFRAQIASNVVTAAHLVSQSSWFLVVGAAFYAVDTFFFISGFLVTFILLEKLKKMPCNIKNYLKLVFHRFIRIWPAYALCILIFWKLTPHFGSGPVWYQYISWSGTCGDQWWQNMTFTDIYLTWGDSDYCFGWGWYLANDMQMFLVAPFLIWLYLKNSKVGVLVVIGGIITTLILGWIMIGVTDFGYSPMNLPNSQQYSEYYIRPYCRAPPYLYGILFALWYKNFKFSENARYLRWKNMVKSSALISYAITFTGIGILCMIVFEPRSLQLSPGSWPEWYTQLFQGGAKITYVIGLSLTFLPSLLGARSILSWLMNNKIMMVLAKLSFTGYLVHLMIVYMLIYQQGNGFYFNSKMVFFDYITMIVLTLFSACFISLIIELPVVNFEGTFLNPRRPPKEAVKSTKTSEIVIHKEVVNERV